MFLIKIIEKNKSKKLTQWDADRYIEITAPEGVEVSHVDFAYEHDQKAIRRETSLSDGIMTAKVPNSLLQRCGKMRVWLVCDDVTVFGDIFVVAQKAKDEGYVLPDDEDDVCNYTNLEKRIADIEKNGTGGGIAEETDPTVPQWAKQPTKPSYTAEEVGALPKDTKIPTKLSDLENDLELEVEGTVGITDEQINNAVSAWLDEHPEATTTIADSSITVEKMSAYKGKVVKNMFGNMGFKFGTLDTSTGVVTEDDNALNVLVYTKLEPSTTYYMQKNAKGVLSNLAPLEMFFYDSEGNYLSKSYTWDSKFKTPANLDYGIYYVKTTKQNARWYDCQPYQLMPETITGIYPYAYEETLYAEDLKKEKDLIEHIVGEQQEAISEKVTNYFIKSQDTIAEVKSGDVIISNLYKLNAKLYCDLECQIIAQYDEILLNPTVTGEHPEAAQFVIPDGVRAVRFSANNGEYPNANQSSWYKVENPQIVKGIELIDNIEEGENFRFVEEAETEIQKIAKEQAEESMKASGVISPLNRKKWMIWGDSTSVYSNKNYPDFIAERTGCIIYNKAKAGSRVTANEGTGYPIVDEVINNITSDMQVLTLIGGYNDRRSYDSNNPDWAWLGSMLNADGTPNTNKTTFYGALNAIASKWFEVCPEATKAWFTIFPCGMNPNGEYETKINGIIKEVANYWCIPCFDLWNEVGLPVRLDYINQTYYMNDRIHPNDNGNRVASVYIQKKLESIMI